MTNLRGEHFMYFDSQVRRNEIMMYFDCALDSSMVDALLKTNGTFIDVHVKFHTQAQQDFPYFWGKKVPLN